jgi:hypothetical protein
MDFIERWFGVSPDGGDGTLEALFIAVLVAIAGLFVFRRRVVSAGLRLISWTAGRRGT